MGNRLEVTKTITLLGWYQLPAALGVAASCFGKRMRIAVAGRPGFIELPRLRWSGGQPSIVEPSMPSDVSRIVNHYIDAAEEWGSERYWGRVTAWHPEKRIVSEASVNAVLVRFEISGAEVTYSDYMYGRGHPQGEPVDRLFGEIDTWFDTLRTWLEVKVDQDMDPEHPLRYIRVTGQGLHVLSDDGVQLSLPASARNIQVMAANFESVSLALLRRAAKQANAGSSPGDAHLLIRDSRAALRRWQLRRAAIDAATAVELTLADFNRSVTKINTPAKGATLGWYVQQSAIAAQARLPTTLMRDVVHLRNGAIHNNKIPSRTEVVVAINQAKRVANRLSPLPI